MLESLIRSFRQAKNQITKTEPLLIAITSPYGSTGKTTVAINLALELSNEKFRVIIIDADLVGASAANLLSLSELPAGLVGALRIASQHRFDLSQLERLSVLVPKTSITLLPGKMSEQRVDVNLEALEVILQIAKANFDFVILDLGPIINEGADLASTKHILGLADQVLVVATADPVGIYRLLRIEPELLALNKTPKLLINRLRNSVIAQAKTEIKTTLASLGSFEVHAFLPEDPVHVDQATRLGMATPTLGRVGSFREAIGAFTRASILGRQGGLDARVAKLS